MRIDTFVISAMRVGTVANSAMQIDTFVITAMRVDTIAINCSGLDCASHTRSVSRDRPLHMHSARHLSTLVKQHPGFPVRLAHQGDLFTFSYTKQRGEA